MPVPGDVARQAAGHWESNWVAVAFVVAGPMVLICLWALDVIRPGSFKRNKPVMPSDQPAAILLCAGMIVYVASAVGYTLAHQFALPFPCEISELTLKGKAALQAGSYLVGVPVAILMAHLASGGLRRIAGWRDVPTGVGLMVVVYTVVAGCSMLAVWVAVRIDHHSSDPIAHETLRVINDNPQSWPAIVMMLCAVVGASIFEEVVYRLFLQTAILRLTGRPWRSVVLTAAVFAGQHMGVVDWPGIPPLFVLGLAFGIAFARTGRIAVPIVMHAAFNAGNIALTIWPI